MQLGEVLEQTTAPTPRPRRRRRPWLLPLLSAGALAGALAIHGPGVVIAEASEIVIITREVDVELLGPPVRVARGGELHFHVPIAQHAWRLPAQHRTPEAIRLTAYSGDGVAFRLQSAGLGYRPTLEGAERLFRTLGPDPRAWDAAARHALAEAWVATLEAAPATALLAGTPGDLLKAVRADLEPRLDRTGLTLVDVAPPSWRVAPEIRAALSALQTAAAEHGAAAAAAWRVGARAEAAEAEAEAARRAANDAERAAADALVEAARGRAEAVVAEARAQAEREAGAARAARDTLTREAEVIGARSALEAAALAQRVAAVADHGPALLDHVIATEVLPQLRRLRAGRPAAPPAKADP